LVVTSGIECRRPAGGLQVGRRWIHDHKLVVNVKELDEDFAGRPRRKEEEVAHLDELVDEVEETRERVRGRPHT
jgi:hypothetical protein